MHQCPECGQSVDVEALFCQKCGTRLSVTPGEQSLGDGEASSSARAESGSRAFRNRMTRDRWEDKDSEEELLWEGGFSGRSMLGSWALALLVTLAAITLAVMLPSTVPYRWTGATLVILVAWCLPLLRLAYRKLSIRYRVTSHRLFHEEGILWRTTNRVELIDVDDVTVKQSIFGRIMNVGTVRLESSDRTDPELYLLGIEDPMEVAEKIDTARRRERTRRGIHIEAI